MTRRANFTIGALLVAWAILIGWQGAEHVRVKRAAQRSLINRAQAISSTLGLLLRSQRFFGIVSKERLESALKELVGPGELQSVVLLNNLNEDVASAGPPPDPEARNELPGGALWLERSVAVQTLVDLGTNVTQELEEKPRAGGASTLVLKGSEIESLRTNRPPRANEASDPSRTNRARPRRRRGPNFGPFEKPEWMSDQEYSSLIQKKGLHSMIIVMSNESFREQDRNDLWLRSMVALLGTVSLAGFGFAWRNLGTTSDLQIRLVRASELNTHLKQMNLAAAGLAHETRNPLNIIRGRAQMISKEPGVSAEVSKQCREIVEETDRVTAQLNEFINYSRPREIRLANVSLRAAVAEIARALGSDIEEKRVLFRGVEDDVVIKADEALLRQALFNLALNAIQAVERDGEIHVVARRDEHGEAVLEIRDDGPGVPPERRDEVFKPYFTTNKKGTGLGLAVVHQIVMAHGWEIKCLANEPRGANFRLSHLKVAV